MSIFVRRRTYRSLIDLNSQFNRKSDVRVGFPASKVSDFVVMKATKNEFGSPRENIPERPFFRLALSKGADGIQSVARRQVGLIIKDTITMEQARNRLGIYAVGLIQQSIVDLRTPPNAAITIELKKSSNPLIDTGEMRQSVTYE